MESKPCAWYYDDYCVNHDCPYCAEWCECAQHQEVCRFYEPVKSNKAETCVCCGATIPEGRQYCPNCLVNAKGEAL